MVGAEIPCVFDEVKIGSLDGSSDFAQKSKRRPKAVGICDAEGDIRLIKTGDPSHLPYRCQPYVASARC